MTRLSVRARIIALLEDYAPLPLTYDDLVDELGLKRRHIQMEVSKLSLAGVTVRSAAGPGTRGRGAVVHIRLANEVES